MSEYPINFSKTEMSFIQDQDFLLSKVEIEKKMKDLMGRVEQELYPSIQEYSWPKEVLSKSGKISKGDNYKGLPYYILDFPRRFDKEGVLAFRTMFWWGNFFSATLHLSGKYLEIARGTLLDNLENIRSSQAYICVYNTPWEYHYGTDNYLPARQIEAGSLQSIFTKKPFVKISYHWPLDQYIELPGLVSSVFSNTQSWITEQ